MPTSFDLTVKNGKCFVDGQLKIVDIGISEGIIKSVVKIEKASSKKLLASKIFSLLVFSILPMLFIIPLKIPISVVFN